MLVAGIFKVRHSHSQHSGLVNVYMSAYLIQLFSWSWVTEWYEKSLKVNVSHFVQLKKNQLTFSLEAFFVLMLDEKRWGKGEAWAEFLLCSKLATWTSQPPCGSVTILIDRWGSAWVRSMPKVTGLLNDKAGVYYICLNPKPMNVQAAWLRFWFLMILIQMWSLRKKRSNDDWLHL